MLTKEVSQKYLNDALISIHSKRANCLFETAWSLTKQANLTISSLGEKKDGNAYVKHKIKSVDRLVGNSKLHKEIPLIYKEFFQPLIASTPTLYILVDWSGCCRQDIHMLRASIVHNGRSITIYNEIHPQKKYGNREVQRQFLASLKKIIPMGKKVVIITDAGFATPWFNAVLKLGWDYIGRLSNCTMVQLDNKEWVKVKEFHPRKNDRVKFIGKAKIAKASQTPVYGNIYCYKSKQKGRKDKSRYPEQNKRFSAVYKNPWMLATSLKNSAYSGDFIKDMYKNRMQIEQNFRDEKSPRFGFGWRLSRNNCMKRIAVLCLIAHIAAFFLLSIGIMAEKLGLHKRFQVNTEKKRVLSLLTLGKQIVTWGLQPILYEDYKKGLIQLMATSQELYPC